ncbi:winged helix-turn-helix transcriptional regulator [Photobacterium damselae subsp. damselae]|uniref:winged helix-turn-helix domain-containing protein n=1 Tax=Photobacterium damselae TaxID=38293 RepID=UPI001592BBC1|nr:winged helix-turn-helix domain-containing protein [Photobacterium damselae]NVH51089.1 winged helix-turn-helix transcriptional regulator [Photobacterium damselae subsp. damselae]NVO81197.1 winged helix-turn-helix transcriptional regulator [Photobacterium damselae subsp. damselae]
MWWINIPAIAAAVKVVTDEVNRTTDISVHYKNLDKESKGKLIQALNESGVSQKRIAKSLGISASAVSQRLKNTLPVPVRNEDSVSKLYELKHIGISNKAIAKLLTSEDFEVTHEDVEAFFIVLKASKQNLT